MAFALRKRVGVSKSRGERVVAMKMIPFLIVLIPGILFGQCSYEKEATEICCEPDSYQELDDKGVCYDKDYGMSGDICWKIESVPSDTIHTNIGYQVETNGWCNGVSFSNVRLLNSSCDQVSSGTEHGDLTPGDTYYFCFSYEITGGLFCDGKFTSFCPHYIDRKSPLPVEFIDFWMEKEDKDILRWKVASETNNRRFIIRRGNDKWYIKGRGSTPISKEYSKEVEASLGTYYYTLYQEDINGERKKLDVIGVMRTDKGVGDCYNTLGQKVKEGILCK